MLAYFSQVQGRSLNQCFSSDFHLNLIIIHGPTNQVLAEGLHNEKMKTHTHLLVLDVLLLKPMQDLLLQPETKEKKVTDETLKTAHQLCARFLYLAAK